MRPVADWLLAARALALLARARAGHATRPAARSLARLRHPPPPRRGAAPAPERLGWALAAAARRAPFRADCLVQALAARLWLDATGTPARVRLAARRDAAGALVAHVWLEVAGVPVSGGAPAPALAEFREAAGPAD